MPSHCQPLPETAMRTSVGVYPRFVDRDIRALRWLFCCLFIFFGAKPSDHAEMTLRSSMPNPLNLLRFLGRVILVNADGINGQRPRLCLGTVSEMNEELTRDSRLFKGIVSVAHCRQDSTYLIISGLSLIPPSVRNNASNEGS